MDRPPAGVNTSIPDEPKSILLDWPVVVETSCSAGLALILAQYGVLRSWDNDSHRLVLELPTQLAALVEHGGERALLAALTSYFGAELHLEIAYGEARGSMADRRKQAALESCAKILRTFADSGLIEEMGDAFGAKPVLSSLSYSQ